MKIDCISVLQAPEKNEFIKVIRVDAKVTEMRLTLNHFFPHEILKFNRFLKKHTQIFFLDLMTKVEGRGTEITAWIKNATQINAGPIFKLQRGAGARVYPDSPCSIIEPSQRSSTYHGVVEITTFEELENLLLMRRMDPTLIIKIDGIHLKLVNGVIKTFL